MFGGEKRPFKAPVQLEEHLYHSKRLSSGGNIAAKDAFQQFTN